LGIAAPSKQFLLNLFPLTAAIFASPSEGPQDSPERPAEAGLQTEVCPTTLRLRSFPWVP
jgi:hypothetical protein